MRVVACFLNCCGSASLQEWHLHFLVKCFNFLSLVLCVCSFRGRGCDSGDWLKGHGNSSKATLANSLVRDDNA